MMHIRLIISLIFLCAISCGSPSSQQESQTEPAASSSLLGPENLYAWCIVPFDSKNRGPEERIAMLQELGIKQYAYDWRDHHLPTFGHEIEVAANAGIDMMAVWMWIDINNDQPGKLSDGNEQILQTVQKRKLNTQIWVGFNANYFEGKSEAEKLAAGVEMIAYLDDRAKEGGNGIILYNHGDWFGEPANQVKLIEEMPGRDIGIVYSFHHAHLQVDRFPEIVKVMMPYLRYVNLNGMQADGPQILPVGSGNLEQQMLQTLLDAGYAGPFGILGHVEDRDVAEVLSENLEGLKKLEQAVGPSF